MMRSRSWARLALLVLSCTWVLGSRTAWATPPNVVVIMLDDLGWSDVSYHDSPAINAGVKTPEIDAFVAGGLELRNLYASPDGFQTRAAILTGRFPLRYGFQGVVAKSKDEAGLPRAETTLPRLLKEYGYQTFLVGSWGLGSDDKYRPLDRGYDHHYGPVGDAIEQFGHCEPRGKLDWYRDGAMNYDEGFSADLLADEAMRILEARTPKGPVYIHLGFTTPHKPYQAPQAFIQQYLDDPVPERRLYQASVAATDAAIGRVLKKLDELGIADDTLVFFLSDNGGDSKNGRGKNLPFRGSAGSDQTEKLYEGGARVPAAMRWTGTIEPGVLETPAHSVDIFTTVLTAAGGQPADNVDGKDLRNLPTTTRTIPIVLTKKTVVLRRGNWKIVTKVDTTTTTTSTTGASTASSLMMARALTDDAATWEPTKAELFDLSRDPNETTDQSKAQPAVVQSMLQEIRSLLAVAAAPGTPSSSSTVLPGQTTPPAQTTESSTGSN